jgi:O-antigen/teichoic acid export membrane protein
LIKVFARALIFSSGIRLIGTAFGFLVGVQLARGLGVEAYGVYALAISIIAFASVLTEFGFPQLVTREVAIAATTQDWPRIKATLLWGARRILLVSLICIFVASVAAFVGAKLDHPLTNPLLVGSLLIPLVAVAKTMAATNRALDRIVASQIPESIIRPAAMAACLSIALYVGVLTPTIAVSLAVVAALLSLVTAAALFRTTAIPKLRNVSAHPSKLNLWSSVIPLGLTEAVRVMQGHLAAAILGALSTFAAVGVYKVAQSTFLLVTFPLSLVALIGSPMVARYYASQDSKKLHALVCIMAVSMTLATATVLLTFALFGQPLFELVFGNAFAHANTTFLVLCVGGTLSSCFGAGAVILNMSGHQKFVTKATLVSLGAQIVLCLLLVPYFAALGAAIATGASSVIWTAVLWWYARVHTGLDTSILAVYRYRNQLP